MYLIGIAGGSGSGKTTFAKKLQCSTEDITIISMDSYYLPSAVDIVKTEAGKTNCAKLEDTV